MRVMYETIATLPRRDPGSGVLAFDARGIKQNKHKELLPRKVGE